MAKTVQMGMRYAFKVFFTDGTWRENAVAAYASVGLLVFLTSFFWSPTRDFMHVVYCLAFFVPVLLVLILRKPNLIQYGGWFTGLGLIYAAYASLSTMWSDAPRPEFFAQHFLFLVVWLAGTAWLASRGMLNADRVVHCLVLTGAVASVAFQIIFHLQNYPLGYADALGTRLRLSGFGVTRNPNTIGFIFGATTILAYIYWLKSFGWRQALPRFLMLCLNGGAVAATQSRGPILALVFTLALGFGLYRGISRKWKTHAIAVLLLSGGLTIAIQQEIVPNRWDSTSLGSSLRPEIWHHFVNRAAEEHIWFGRGLVKTTRIVVPEEDRLPFAHHAHNSYIDAFFWTGIVGVMLMCIHMLYVFRYWSNSSRLLPFYMWLLFGCLTALVDRPGFFEHLNPHWFAYWIPAGLIGALVMAERQKSSST